VALRTFATCFCLPNSLHVNGDQSGTGKSQFTYRPFTLEGNFACAQGIQEMLLQSQNGRVRIFPAIPHDWKDVSFTNLRAEGALLITARQINGNTRLVKVVAEKGGMVKLVDPFGGRTFKASSRGVGPVKVKDGFIEFESKAGGFAEFVRK
jgi:alpha-L-fucosidase 2